MAGGQPEQRTGPCTCSAWVSSELMCIATESICEHGGASQCFNQFLLFLQLDPYDYEMIEVVLKVLEQANEKN